MKYITEESIRKLNISPEEACAWVGEALCRKPEAVLPVKTSISLPNGVFYNTMPTVLPYLGVAGVKIISRYPGANLVMKSQILLYDLKNGNLLSMLDGGSITNLRTGAVAALAAEQLGAEGYSVVGFYGLGNTAAAVFEMLRHLRKTRNAGPLKVYLLKYKDQAERFAERYGDESGVSFEICSSPEEIASAADVLFSCVTVAERDFCDERFYKSGSVVIPVHTRGFMNCDRVFDRVIVDDTDSVRDFRYFSEFRNLAELSDVLRDPQRGRQSPAERILSYNIGLAIHDIFFAKKIYDRLEGAESDRGRAVK